MLPKVDVHRHLGGCISSDTIWDIIRYHQPGLARTKESVYSQMVCEYPCTFDQFLNKFKILDHIIWTDDAIDKAIEQVVRDIAAEGITYSEISLSINKYIKHQNASPADILCSIRQKIDKYEAIYNTKINILLSIRYDSDIQSQIDQADLINTNISDFVHGIDLVGDEKYFDKSFHGKLVRSWVDQGKQVRAHVGEIPGTNQAVLDAISIGVNRIAHGIHADAHSLEIANKHNIYFDLALMSNLCLRSANNIYEHPITNMIKSGCLITINTDDPIQFNSTLDKEYELASKILTSTQINTIKNNAINLSRMADSYPARQI